MNSVFYNKRIRNNRFRVVDVPFCSGLQSPSNSKPSSSPKPLGPPKVNRLHKGFRVLDLVTSKANVVNGGRQTHLRLIQDILPTNSDQLSAQQARSEDNDSKDDPVSTLPSDLSRLLSYCGTWRTVDVGIQVHCLAIKTGLFANVYVGSSLISFYSKCGGLDSAYRVFEEMPVRNVVSWTAMITGFAQEWQVDVCLELYGRMRNSAAKPNDFTLTSLLSACTGSGSLGQGKSTHCQAIQMGFNSYLHVSNALISMYCKCGDVNEALYVFETMDGKDIVSWNSMIAGYAQHGLALLAIDLFEEMKQQRLKPDAITFLGVLSSCRHAGLVDQGWFYLNSMVEFGVEPELDHYSCIVDLLGRAGDVEGARDFIKKMPASPNAVIWGSLLSSCRLHGNVWIGIEAAESRLLLEPGCAATHLQLVNLYASVGYWDQVARVRKLMKDKGLRTDPGCSWIEVKNVVYQFRAEDSFNSKLYEINVVLDCLVDHMSNLGYMSEIHRLESCYDLQILQLNGTGMRCIEHSECSEVV
ncbi:pentatricopeptide repeat-containing protein At2g37320 [Diospyros lotus]|uniref:pentatricopeptide repeat-containing protein At2g37320 n=1 Tax=Diospyros lotus TaxID=55363 RepID=UPI00224CD111|nr:pentatricopeptide repeat-containing protein At2g37320 [Diospyros lotus]